MSSFHARVDPLDHAQCAAVEAAARLRDDRVIARALRILQRRACKPGQAMGMSLPAAPFFGCDLLMRSASTLKRHFSTLNTAYSR